MKFLTLLFVAFNIISIFGLPILPDNTDEIPSNRKNCKKSNDENMEGSSGDDFVEINEVLNETELAAKHKAMERPDLYGGDILGIPLHGNETGPENRNQVKYYQWPRGVVPYVIHESLRNYTDKINRAFSEYHAKTCIRFRPATSSDSAYIQLQNGNGCNSYIGKTGQKTQPINLQTSACLNHGTILHELGHALGFVHTQKRPDRDRYVTINWGNIQYGKRDQFDCEEGLNLVPYDISSVMHYHSYQFSSNGRPTILTNKGGIIRDARGLSSLDVRAIRSYYC